MQDDDKIYNLLEKVYIELQDTKSELKGTKNDVSNLSSDVSKLSSDVSKISSDVSKISLTIENEIKPNIKLLFETQTHILTKLEEHDKRFDAIDKKLDKHDVEICVIKGGNRGFK